MFSEAINGYEMDSRDSGNISNMHASVVLLPLASKTSVPKSGSQKKAENSLKELWVNAIDQ